MLKKLTVKHNLIVTTLAYTFLHFDLVPPSKYFGTCILNTFWGAVFYTCILNTYEIMYLYLYFKYFFGWVLVLVLKILLKSILPNTGEHTLILPNHHNILFQNMAKM